MRRIEIAIRNIFKEQGYTVKSITENTVTVDRFKEVTYNYTVQDDLIIITNKNRSHSITKSQLEAIKT